MTRQLNLLALAFAFLTAECAEHDFHQPHAHEEAAEVNHRAEARRDEE